MRKATAPAPEPNDSWFYRLLDQEAAQEAAQEQFIQRFKDALAPSPSQEGRLSPPVDHWRNEAIEQLYETEKQTTAFNRALFDLWANPQSDAPGQRLIRLLDEAIEATAKRAFQQNPSAFAVH